MNDNELNDPQGGILSDPMDRRSALKKAAVAGAIVWTAPMVISSKGHADHDAPGNGVCTPACALTSFDPQIVARDACAGEEELLQEHFGTANKIAILRVIVPGGIECPCSDEAPVVVIGITEGTLWDKVSGNTNQPPATCEYSEQGNKLPSAKHPTNEDEFIIFDQGAVGNGWYTSSEPVCISVGCPDEIGGDIVYRTCSFKVCVAYEPSGSICTISPPLDTFLTQVGDCTVGCEHC